MTIKVVPMSDRLLMAFVRNRGINGFKWKVCLGAYYVQLSQRAFTRVAQGRVTDMGQRTAYFQMMSWWKYLTGAE